MAERTIPITTDFYTVSMGMNTMGDFASLLKRISDSPDDDSRTHLIGSSHIRIHACEDKADFWFATATRIKMDEEIVKARLNGDWEHLELEEDQGIGYDAGIAYRKDRNILLLQRNRNVLTSDTLSIYIEKHAQCFPIEFGVMLKGDAMLRLREENYYKKVLIKIARPACGFFAGSPDQQPEELEAIMNDLNAPELEIRLSVGRKKKGRSLSSEAVNKLVDKWLHRRPSVESLAVNGIELIDGLLGHSERLQSSGNLTNEMRWQSLVRAWQACANEIAPMQPLRGQERR